jgi:nucleoside-diphosphate-sugar epimerase
MPEEPACLVITGSSGFVGERLAIAAEESGFDVIGIDLKSSEKLNCQQFICDLAKESIAPYVPDGSTIIHLASLSTDSACRENPTLAIDANLRALSLITQAATTVKTNHLIFASSEWVYPESDLQSEQHETDRLELIDLESLYAISKIVGESIVRTTSTTPYSILRFGIVYGPRKTPGSAAESLALKAYRSEDIEVGSPLTSRRLIYIDDLIEAILRVVNFGPVSENGLALNLSGAELVSLSDVVSIVNEEFQTSGNIVDLGKSPSIRNPSNSRAKALLGWAPKTEFSSGIKQCLQVMTNQEIGGL